MLYRVEFLRRDAVHRNGAVSTALISAGSVTDLHELAWAECKVRNTEGFRARNLHTRQFTEVWD